MTNYGILFFSLLAMSIVFGVNVEAITHGEEFGYDGNIGPSHWGERYRECAGKHQSPININVLRVKQVTLPDLVLVGFDDSIDNVHVTNNGHTDVEADGGIRFYAEVPHFRTQHP